MKRKWPKISKNVPKIIYQDLLCLTGQQEQGHAAEHDGAGGRRGQVQLSAEMEARVKGGQ